MPTSDPAQDTVAPLQPAARMQDLPASFFHGLNQRLADLKARGVDVIRMDMGSPDLPPPPEVIATLERVARDPHAHGYMPFGGTPAYREAWAEFYGRRFGVELDASTEVLGLLGSKEGIFQLAMAYINPGDVVLVPDPGYATYTAGAQFAGGEVVYLPLTAERAFLPDLHAIPAEVLQRVRLLWLNYPNNPTGATAPLEFFAEAVALARRHGFLIAHDAPYTEVTYDGYVAPSFMQVPGAKEVAVEFHSLSKTSNMAGWRVAAVVGNADVIRTLAALQSQVNSGHFKAVLDAGTAALKTGRAWIDARNAQYRERRDIVVPALRSVGLAVQVPQATLYVWARLPGAGDPTGNGAARPADDYAYSLALLEGAGVTVTPGSVFGPAGAGYVRISLGTATPRVREAMDRWARWASQA